MAYDRTGIQVDTWENDPPTIIQYTYGIDDQGIYWDFEDYDSVICRGLDDNRLPSWIGYY